MKNNNPKYAFYYLLSLVSLIFMAISSAMIIFQIINKNIFDALSNYSGAYDGQMRFGVSALLISAPIFFLMVRLINKGLRKNELDDNSGIRRWLTYFILFVSAVIILGSLIGVINSFLSGGMTLKSVLQFVTVILISVLVFSFYLYDIKREDLTRRDPVLKIFFWGSIALVAVVFVSALFFVESPKVAREKKADQIVLNNIYSLENSINSYYDINKALPDNLDEMSGNANVYFDKKSIIDQESGESIEYRKIGEKDFELCATFRTDSNTGDQTYYIGTGKDYKKGWNCFKGNLWSDPKILEKNID
ncbi:hypothetical protein CVU82_01655 [Candidatus Falkowbacteria bacterium HGW-Falkowbacteria-1]|jgi:hypothetical protein|uniref:DUF5671 domain-containing protein n=1 Tax=Candidatus Falkowbacteria bacterium HGW-Falkowbacteria-1 TaxID=2013768 RepID=A0A2N2E9D7_9BACT|nr:MAG: hypothetical protein CVU82_01655 [Candidatus Falkowbacteria bacterium HGW-Falkowbacteria-1]